VSIVRTELGFPLEDGTAVRWEELKTWVDDATKELWINYSLRCTAKPIPGEEGLVRLATGKRFIMLDPEKSEEQGEVIFFQTHAASCKAVHVEKLMRAIVAGKVCIKAEGASSWILGE
jgi:hypothetical protein